jgi:predicted DCC family thiol-disulfide oxidoreductase YuxK
MTSLWRPRFGVHKCGPRRLADTALWQTYLETESRIVVFDGLCHLCSGGARWLQHHQSKPPFYLVPMQSDLGRTLLTQHGYDPDDPLTFLVLDGDRCFTQSDAWIHLVAAAGRGWRLVHAARVIPRAWRDSVYRLIARNRYRWFGRWKTCYLAQPLIESDPPPKPWEKCGP